MGTLMYNSERDSFELDGQELHNGESIDLAIFGYWIPGQVTADVVGWHLLTPDQVEIPLHSGLTAHHGEPGSSPLPAWHPVALNAPHILLVDDDPALLRALPQTVSLRLPQARVDTTDSAQGALEQIQQYAYDTIVSDIRMPGMDGLQLLARIQELRPGTPTLLITGHGDQGLEIQALRGGAFYYILKPIDRDYFIASLQRAIQVPLLRRQVAEQQLALELYARLLEGLVQQQTQELFAVQATREQLITLVSHELKAPLADLRARTHLLRLKLGLKLEGTPLPEMVSQGLAEIEQALGQTERRVQQVLHPARLESPLFLLERQRCDLVELCGTVLHEYAASAGSVLTGESPRAPIEVEVDESRMSRLLIGLLSQAQAHARPGSALTIRLQASGQKAILTLGYSGDPLELGLAFYVWRKLVEQHAGRLEVQSAPASGMSYFLMLPRRLDPAREQSETAEHAPRTHALWMLTVPGNEGERDIR